MAGGQGELTQTPPMSKMQAFTTIMMYSSSFVRFCSKVKVP